MSNGRTPDGGPPATATEQWRRRYRALADVASGAVFELDTDGRFVAIGDELVDATGYDREVLEGSPPELLVDESDIEACEAAIRRCLDPSGPESETVEVTVRPADGGGLTATVRLHPIVVDGEFRGTVGLARNVPEQLVDHPPAEEELAELFDRFTDAFFALDDEWRFTYVNERAEEALDVDAADVLGESVWEEFPEAVDSTFQEKYEEAMETQETVSFEEYYPPLDSWFEVHAYPSETGLSVYFRDVTERKDHERTLERYRTLTQALSDAIVTVDEDGVIRSANPSIEDVFGYVPDEIVGEPLTTLVPEDYVADHAEAFEAYLESGERTFDWDYVEFPGRHRDGHEVPLAVSFSEYEHEGERYFTGVLRDISERARYERALEELHGVNQQFAHAESAEEIADQLVEAATDVVDLPGVAVYLYDESAGVLRPASATGPMEEPYRPLPTVDPETESHVVAETFVTGETDVREDLAPLSSDIYTGAHIRRALSAPLGEHGVLLTGDLDAGTFDERTLELAELLAANAASALDRLGRERELRTRVDQQTVVADLGRRALSNQDLDSLFEEAVEAVSETLDTDYCKVLDLDAAESHLELRAGVGWRDGLVGEATVETDRGSQAGYTLLSNEPVVVEDMAREERFQGPDLLRSHDVTSGISTVIGPADDPWGVLGTHDTERRDFSEEDATFVQSVANVLATAVERRDRERTLRRAYEIIGDADRSFEQQVDALLELGRETLDLDYGTLSQVQGEEYVFERVATPADADLERGDTTALSATNCERAIERGETLALEDVAADAPDLADRAGNAEWGIACYLGTPVVVDGEPYGTFCFYDMEAKADEFSEWEVTFVDLLGDWVGTELERQRDTERLSTLDQLNGVVRDIAEAALRQSSREEVERLVCERLADADSFKFAWVGELDDDSVVNRVEAGVEDYLEDARISLDDDELREGPTAQAIRTQEVQVVQNVLEDPRYEPWREQAREYGFRSSAAVPIVDEDTLYGVLNVYSERPTAFGEHEREVLSHLGNTVGHALAAIERRRAFMGDESVEIEFRIEEFLDGVLDTGGDPITFEQIIPTGDGEFVSYGTAGASAVDALDTFEEEFDPAEDIQILDESDERVRFKLDLVEPPVSTVVTENNGRVRNVTIEERAVDFLVELPVGDNVRPTVESIQETFPDAEVIAQRQEHRDHEPDRWPAVLDEDLTDRQRSVLEAAYFGGYFEWPRSIDGEELADSMNVSSPTVHQHLRTAQRKLLRSLFESE